MATNGGGPRAAALLRMKDKGLIDPFAVAGYRRDILITPQDGYVTAALEDDYHAMLVALHHDNETITRVESRMVREPWTTCPGAVTVLADTFTGVALMAASKRGEKRTNCTHLHDLSTLAAAHALDGEPTHYQIAVSDVSDGVSHAVVRRNAEDRLHLSHTGGVLSDPTELAGVSVFAMREWIAALDSAAQEEAARLLQWGTIVAMGRTIDWSQPYDASAMPPNCYNFQPGRRDDAVRLTAHIRDFTDGTARAFDRFDPAGLPSSIGRD